MADSIPASIPAALQFQHDVKQQVENLEATNGTRHRVVLQLAEAEIQRRTKILVSALDKRSALASELKKIKPDNVMHAVGENGERSKMEYFSEARLKELDQGKSKLEKLDRLIEAAMATPSTDAYNKLEEASK